MDTFILRVPPGSNAVQCFENFLSSVSIWMLGKGPRVDLFILEYCSPSTKLATTIFRHTAFTTIIHATKKNGALEVPQSPCCKPGILASQNGGRTEQSSMSWCHSSPSTICTNVTTLMPNVSKFAEAPSLVPGRMFESRLLPTRAKMMRAITNSDSA